MIFCRHGASDAPFVLKLAVAAMEMGTVGKWVKGLIVLCQWFCALEV